MSNIQQRIRRFFNEQRAAALVAIILLVLTPSITGEVLKIYTISWTGISFYILLIVVYIWAQLPIGGKSR